ncbi:ShlB/FhaC/HecB family hemolysin secretion/activation protein [uncultured Azonexus sp.]|uniref:ShlB/FhaC/HecB family hemolysin secretion/activation protein n=1 Tax=uncultured Azonexus sp. TaxID=520307 RepID=UPI00260FAFCD|nr:ShlB/FhaC/HecB family hemolysin secretion/activation protein [uncultured Azonexus sp.]
MKSTYIPFFLALPVSLALAQQQPDAGQTLQQQQQAPQLPRTGPAIDIQSPAVVTTVPGGTEVKLASLTISGTSVFSEAELVAVLGEIAGKSYDLAGLRALAERISRHYRENGYPFARAFIPQQTMHEGKLRIEVVEGRYGQVQVLGDQALVTAATGFLSPLKTGDLIASAPLERATLVLDDQPGIHVAPIIRPGQQLGTGDLDVRVERTPGLSGDVGFDNHGNRFTGEYRARANLQWDSPFSFGDQVALRLLYSNEAMWIGALSYSLPLGSSGLRGNIGYSHTYYELAKDFANLGATGTAKVTSLGLSYPLIRSQKANLTLAATWQKKALNDKQESANTNDDKSSDSMPITLNFDRRDSIWGGGITYGSLTYTTGRLKLGSVLENTDRASGQNTRGSFDKWNLDIARVQATPVTNLVLFGRLSAQSAGKNLDSSEGFSLGGANGVRAYPSGEGNGDEGWLVQLEARYTVGPYSLYLFHDSGRVALNANNSRLTTPAKPNHRSISGEGVGMRYNRGNWNMDATLGWRNHGGPALSDGRERNPRLWVTAGYRF